MRCQPSQIIGGLRGSFSTIRPGFKGWIFVPTPVALRAKPTLIGKPIFQTVDGAVAYDPGTITVENIYANGVLIAYTNTEEKCICYGSFGFDSNL